MKRKKNVRDKQTLGMYEITEHMKKKKIVDVNSLELRSDFSTHS